jgi:MoxR-like ATPase
MNQPDLIAGSLQCVACGRVSKVTRSHLGHKLRCKCGNIVVADEQDLIAVATSVPLASDRNTLSTDDDVAVLELLKSAYSSLTEQLSSVVIGQQSVVEEVLIGIFCRGHVLLVGVPGLAKTLLVSSISQVLDLDFRRVQFTPDLMPADITGTEVLQEDRTTGKRHFQFVEGPLFSNMMLADEINRAPPKTQAALLEAMQERQVTVAGRTMPLPSPFFVLATQNPIEQEGTYPLPEAQLDRFLLNISVDYPSSSDEFAIIKEVASGHRRSLAKVLNAEQILQLQEAVLRVPVADHVIGFARDLVRATRPNREDSPAFVKELVAWGAGPRAGISLVMAAKARAILQGRFHVTTSDIAAVARPVLRHRIVTAFNAEAAGVSRDDLVEMLLREIKPKKPVVTTMRGV